jgi:hypothetical protein
VDHFVYADFDMEPLSEEQLFDSQTLHDLDKVGIVMAKWGDAEGVENGFQILSRKQPHLLEALRWAVIDLNIARAHRFLNNQLYIPRFQKVFSARQALLAPNSNQVWKEAGAAIAQMVYESYGLMFKYFYCLEKLGSLKVLSSDEEYEKEKHGLIPFGVETSRVLNSSLKFESIHPSLRVDRFGFPPIPAKRVKLPSSLGAFQ